MTMRIRVASAEDAAGIAKVHVVAWRAAYRGVLPSSYPDSIDLGERTRLWESLLHPQEPEGTTLVAESEVGVFGFARASRTRDDDQDAAAVGEVHAEENLRARAFYEAVGWTADGTVKRDEVGGVPVRGLRYRRALA
jgi:hypothetical protein